MCHILLDVELLPKIEVAGTLKLESLNLLHVDNLNRDHITALLVFRAPHGGERARAQVVEEGKLVDIFLAEIVDRNV